MQFIQQGERRRGELVLSQDDYLALKHFNLIKEDEKQIKINHKEITTINDNGKHHYFVKRIENGVTMAEHLNDEKQPPLLFDVSSEFEAVGEIERYLLRKQKINDFFDEKTKIIKRTKI